MAFIEEFYESTPGATSRLHSTCSCGWRMADRAGVTVLQLDTYGSDVRKDQGTVSQSLQLDEQGARELMSIMRRAFPGL